MVELGGDMVGCCLKDTLKGGFGREGDDCVVLVVAGCSWSAGRGDSFSGSGFGKARVTKA